MTRAINTTTVRWWRLLLAALAAAVAVLLGAGTASAATAPNLKTRVGASTPVKAYLVGVHESVSAGQRWAKASPHANSVVATGVAAKTADVLPTPVVESTKLQNIVNNLYKGTTNPNRVGNGTTMDAIRNELSTGVPTGGRMHLTKGQESLRGLDNWLTKNPEAPYYDRLVAQSLVDELRGVLPR